MCEYRAPFGLCCTGHHLCGVGTGSYLGFVGTGGQLDCVCTGHHLGCLGTGFCVFNAHFGLNAYMGLGFSWVS